MKYHAFAVLLFLFGSACGGDDDDNINADADVQDLADAGTTEPDAEPPEEVFAYALGSDSMTSGILTEVALDDLSVSTGVVAGVATNDSVVRRFGDKLYIVNRFGADNVTIVDTTTKQLVAQISTGAGTNPQDVAVVGDSIYVCAFNSGSIIVLDETDEQATPTLIDISSYDADGVPNCGSIIEVGGTLYAALGILDENFTSQGGKVVAIDTADDTISTDFDLTHNNPFGLFEASPSDGPFLGDLLIATTEDFGTGNGCVERVTPGASPSSAGCLIQNSELGGYVSKLQIVDNSVVLAVSTSFTEGKLVRVDASGTLSPQSITPGEQHVTDFVACPSGDILANDRTQGTIRVFGANDEERTASTGLDIGLPAAFTNGMVCF